MDTWSALSTFQARSIATSGNRECLLEKELVKDFLLQVPMPNVFECLQEASNKGATKDVNLVCQCLERIFRSDVGPEILFQEPMLPFLVAGISHDEAAAKKLTLDMVDLHLTAQFHASMDHDILLHAICDCILDEDSGIARRASNILFKLVSAPDTGVYHKILQRLRDLLSDYLSRCISIAILLRSSHIDICSPSRENSVEYVRLLELVSKCCSVNDVVMAESIALGLVQPVVQGIQSSDALFQLNILDIIPNLCTTRTGLLYVFQSDLLTHLVATAAHPLVGGNALRLIGSFSTLAATHSVQSWNWKDAALAKAFLGAVESALQGGDPQKQIAAMDAVAAFASASDKELGLVLAHRSLCEAWLALGKSTLLEVKSSVFMAVATILARGTRLTTPTAVYLDDNATLWTYHSRLFHALGVFSGRASTMHHLMECLRQPFEPIRVGVYTLLQTVAAQGHPWGLEALHAYGGFIEYLVDRQTEPTKTTREWKFAIVDALLASKFQHVLGARAVEELTKYFDEGPYAGRAKQAEPMMEAS
ncbi:hypothetical protein, variant 1 [Aphanomyces astaci]|uniref:26S proteasome non-ATPase regulatory subunit 5 n=1 Tax=Aphanomyces astaci TaxID=112090 RepID=W4FM95_APHAT|nr:hypothetical protein, variant 1 [Aphanomyces astaci]ETV68632.1 hypothetical protein, variant 1 [Aphanomyces astaci]|eukprot:XP_009841859.1 hypothetical protein, variant 1 [Aphanomyces astaci]